MTGTVLDWPDVTSGALYAVTQVNPLCIEGGFVTTEEATPVESGTDAGVQQIPTMIKLREVPAAAEAREKLLGAIAAEAQTIIDEPTGQASGVLEGLARAYAIVTSGSTAAAPASEVVSIPMASRAGGHQVGLCLEVEP